MALRSWGKCHSQGGSFFRSTLTKVGRRGFSERAHLGHTVHAFRILDLLPHLKLTLRT
ncbi:hypothetical protein NXT3_PB00256 (plasmid) [Sinorhizobium fredii]|uniref:Uncharacterized protein n=1 Tax=Rhizobium fredii TaxID=380 RepID=A0A2L0HBU4_RHIFR|nr:hypothetical protein NXT3_PB00256 [Sinorhizobium fredii]